MRRGQGEARVAWEALVGEMRDVFSRRSFGIFSTVVSGWVLAPGRRTVTAMIGLGDPEGRRAHDAYHRFFREGRWSMEALWKVLAVCVVGRLCPLGVVVLDLDDTLYKKSGRQVEGAGSFRDAVRSTRAKVVYATGLNLVVVTLRVSPPWAGTPIGLPIGARLHRKGGPTTIDLATEMLQALADWLPERSFALAADGAYATLCGKGLARMSVTSRMRRDAALYEPAPPRSGKRGRPRTKGERLATPPQLAATVAKKDWTTVTLDWRGQEVQALVWSRPVLWYRVDKHNLVLLVVVRDPEGHQHDDYFVCTDLDAAPAWVASHYAGRWSIEVCFRDAKQNLGGENPQCWRAQGPERAAALSLWLMTAIWAWYIPTFGTTTTWVRRPWYPRKATPSFLDALAALRRVLWRDRITAVSASPGESPEILEAMIEALAMAA